MQLLGMVRLKNPWHETPIGGFIVTIGQLKQTKQFWSFGEAIEWYRGIALANPSFGLPTNPAEITRFVDQQNALRMSSMAGGDSYIIREGGQAQWETKKATLLKPVVVAGDKVRQLAAGAAILADWLGDGAPPVDSETANTRAVICATCPQNGRGDLSRWFTVFASETIRKQIGAFQDRKLTTPSDEKLGICNACLCPLKLKVHVPVESIKNHLPETARAKLDPRCWITK